ncbi:hypothetical protein ACP275_09G054700 [Erythranthe tilingii]
MLSFDWLIRDLRFVGLASSIPYKRGGGGGGGALFVFYSQIQRPANYLLLPATCNKFQVLQLDRFDFPMVCFKQAFSSFGDEQLVILDDRYQPNDQGSILTIYAPLIGSYAKQWPCLTTLNRMSVWSQEHPHNKYEYVYSLRASNHKPDRSSLLEESSGPSLLPTLGGNIVKGKVKWGDTLKLSGGFQFFKGYCEWTEDVLSRCHHKLKSTKIYDFVYASLLTYDYNSEVMKAFFEAWCPTTNTLLTSRGEMSISLWDLHSLSGLPLTGILYDEVVPASQELVGSDAKGVRYSHRSCRYLFHAYHLLRKRSKDPSSHVSVESWI